MFPVHGESHAEADSQFSLSSQERRMDQDNSALDPGLLQAVLADPILLQAVDPRVLQAVLVSAAHATKVVSTLPPPVPAVPDQERFPSVPEKEEDAEEIDESPEKPQEPLELSSEENRGGFNQNLNSFSFQDQRSNFNFPQSPRALNPNQFGGLGGGNNFLLHRGRTPQFGGGGNFNRPQSGRNFNSFNQQQNPGFGGGFSGSGGQGQGRGQELVNSFRSGNTFNQPQNSGFNGGFAGSGGQNQGRGQELINSFLNGNTFNQPQNSGGFGGSGGQGQGRGQELANSFRQSQGFPRNQQSFNNPQTNQGFNSFNQPGFRGSFSPTQSNFGNNGFGRSFGNNGNNGFGRSFGRAQAQSPGGFGSEIGGQVNQQQGNPNLEVETFQAGNVSNFSFV